MVKERPQLAKREASYAPLDVNRNNGGQIHLSSPTGATYSSITASWLIKPLIKGHTKPNARILLKADIEGNLGHQVYGLFEGHGEEVHANPFSATELLVYPWMRRVHRWPMSSRNGILR